MVSFPHRVFDEIVYEIYKKTNSPIKVINVKNHSLYVYKNKENELYTKSEFNEFDNIKVDNHDLYEKTILNFIKFIMNKE